MTFASKLDAKFWQHHAARYPSDPTDDDRDPFALPPGFDDETRQSVVARRRSLSEWISDATDRAAWITLHVGVVLAIIAFWVMLVLGAAAFVMAVIGGGA